MRPGEQAITRQYIDALLYHEITKDTGRLAGQLRYQWRRKGSTISLADATVAAVALAGQLVLLTDNRKHIPMPELTFYDLP